MSIPRDVWQSDRFLDAVLDELERRSEYGIGDLARWDLKAAIEAALPKPPTDPYGALNPRKDVPEGENKARVVP